MIGRTEEINVLNSLYEGNRSELVVVSGKKGIGKTFLIGEVFKDKFTFRHVALSPEEDASGNATKNQLDAFYLSLIRYGMDKNEKKPETWFEAFFYWKNCLIAKIRMEDCLSFLMSFHGWIPLIRISLRLSNIFGMGMDARRAI